MDSDQARLIQTAAVAVFDFDGTLARFDLDWVELKADLSTLADEAGHPGRFLTTFHPDLAELRVAGGEDLFLAICRTIGEREAGGFQRHTVDTDLVELMVQRQQADLPVAVFSANSGRGIEQCLADPGFRGVTPHVIGREDVVEGKPAAEGLLTIARHFQVEPTELVFIGDAPDDVASAAAAGAQMIQVPKIAL